MTGGGAVHTAYAPESTRPLYEKVTASTQALSSTLWRKQGSYQNFKPPPRCPCQRTNHGLAERVNVQYYKYYSGIR